MGLLCLNNFRLRLLLAPTFVIGCAAFDPAQRPAIRNAIATIREYKHLKNADRALEVLEEVWKYKFVPQTNLVDVHMGHLRHKVDEPNEPPMIHNIRGVGFILRAPV